MNATTTLTYRKTKAGQWVVYGPAAAITPGATVTVTRRTGAPKPERIGRIGRTFVVGGTEMVYGYPERAASHSHSAPRSHNTGGMCDECHTRRAVTTAYDMSGIAGRVCGRCANDGDLSFA